MTRDTTRQHLYATEDVLRGLFDRAAQGSPVVEVEGITLTLPPEGRFASIPSLQEYCDRVCDIIGMSRVNVRATSTGDSAAYYLAAGNILAVPNGRNRWAMRELIVLHELAHKMTPLRSASHGPEFVANYITLLDRVMAPEASLAARVIYRTSGLKEGGSV
jgi:putative metallohydrolase (TIGR04338 family)